jgi:hypothetical protein
MHRALTCRACRAPPQGHAPASLLAALTSERGPLSLKFLEQQLCAAGAEVVPMPPAGLDWKRFAVHDRPIDGILYVASKRAATSVR